MVTLNFSEEKREEKIGNVFVHRIGSGNGKWNKYWYQFFAAWEARSLHRKYHFDGIWAMMAHSCGIPAGIFKTLHPEVPYLLTLQEGDPLEHIERLARPVWPLFKRGFTKADMVVAESTFLGRWARRMGFTGPLEVIPNNTKVGDTLYSAGGSAIVISINNETAVLDANHPLVGKVLIFRIKMLKIEKKS